MEGRVIGVPAKSCVRFFAPQAGGSCAEGRGRGA